MGSLTQDIGTFIADLRHEDLPAAATPVIRNGFTDYVATVVLGRNDEVTQCVTNTLVGGNEDQEARILFSATRKSGPSAALVNGVASHAQDYDDVGLVGIQPTHPSASIAPAIFAEAETLQCDGQAMIRAYVAAFEVWGELASRDPDPVHLKGWHPTGTFGAIAAAAAAASLRGLSANAAAHAVSLAASMASGVIANFGSMAKPYHAGRSAQSGVIAARLAAAGMTASRDALESPLGFLSAISPKGRADVHSPAQFHRRWFMESHGLGFKLFPICYGAHRALDGILALLAKHPFQAEEVISIEVESNQGQFSNLVQTNPQTVLDAKFSMEFAMACAVVAKRCTRAEFNLEFINRPDVRNLISRTKRIYIDTKGHEGDGLIVQLNDGRRFEQRFTYPLGHARRPAPPDAFWTKFEDCVQDAFEPGVDRQLFEKLQSIDRLNDLSQLPVTAGARAAPRISTTP